MDTGEIQVAPVHSRHFAVDERGAGLRATWHPEHGFVNLSLWDGNQCVQTFRLTPVEAGRLVGYLGGVLGQAVPAPAPRPALSAVPDLPAGQPAPTERLGAIRRAARRLRP